MVDLKDLLDIVKPKSDGKEGGLDDLIGGAIDALGGGKKETAKKETKSSGGLDDMISGVLSSLGGDNTDMIMKILKGALTSTALTAVVKTFTSNMVKKPDVVDNLTSSLEKNEVEPNTIESIMKSVMGALGK